MSSELYAHARGGGGGIRHQYSVAFEQEHMNKTTLGIVSFCIIGNLAEFRKLPWVVFSALEVENGVRGSDGSSRGKVTV